MFSIEDLSIDVYKAKGEKSVTLIPDPKIFGKISTELAESYQTSDSSTVDVHAQWLRLVAGTGYDGTVKWGKDGINASGSAYAQAKIVLYEGKKKWLWACPSLEGFILAPNGVDLGAIRFICGTEVFGFSGAVFAASSAFSVSINPNDGKQYLSSISRDPKETILNTLENGKRAVLNTKKGNLNDDISSSNHFNAGINAFAGIQANIAPFGGLQWLDPEKPKDFSDLAKISPTVGLSAGYGVAGDFSLYFREGAFRFRASLALCVGWGGKGALEFTVDMKKFLDLMKFISYQLTYATFKQLTYMLHEDFMTLHKISMMLPFESFQTITKNVERSFDDFINRLDIAEERIKACHKINAKPQWLKYLTPESRGSLLYHITRHGLIARLLDPSEEEGIWLFGTNKLYALPKHKEAVLNIFQSVTQVSHWTNTLQHITADGTKSTKSIAENEKKILKFLNLGVKNNVIPLANLEEIINKINQDHNFPKDYSCGNKYIDEYIKMRGKRVLAYPRGYMITTFDSPDFKQIQIAAGLERPNSFLVQAPKALEDSDLAYYFDDTGTSRMA